MPTPTEIARQTEQFDDDQWFQFLDELDEVTRRRAKRAQSLAKPCSMDRDAIAEWLARKHLLADSSIQEVWYLPAEAPPDEIRLLEVNDRVVAPAGKVEAMDFGLDMEGARFHLLVADVTTEQLTQIKHDPSLLPTGWSLDGNVISGRRK